MGNQWSKWFVRRATLLSRQNHLSLQAKTAFPLPLTPHLHGLVQWNMWQVFAAISEHRRELSAKDISLASEQRSHRRLCSSSVGGWRAPTAASFHLYFTVATFICSSLFLSIFLHKQDKVDKSSDKYVSLERVTARRIIGRAWFLRIERTGNQYEANIYFIKISGFSHWTTQCCSGFNTGKVWFWYRNEVLALLRSTGSCLSIILVLDTSQDLLCNR